MALPPPLLVLLLVDSSRCASCRRRLQIPEPVECLNMKTSEPNFVYTCVYHGAQGPSPLLLLDCYNFALFSDEAALLGQLVSDSRNRDEAKEAAAAAGCIAFIRMPQKPNLHNPYLARDEINRRKDMANTVMPLLLHACFSLAASYLSRKFVFGKCLAFLLLCLLRTSFI
jgi:hypothetical protein